MYLSRVYLCHTSMRLTLESILLLCFILDVICPVFDIFMLKFLYHVINSKMYYIFFHLTKIYWGRRIRNWSNDFSFPNHHVNILHYKNIAKTVEMKTILNEVCYSIEFFLVNIISFLVIFLLEQT